MEQVPFIAVCSLDPKILESVRRQLFDLGRSKGRAVTQRIQRFEQIRLALTVGTDKENLGSIHFQGFFLEVSELIRCDRTKAHQGLSCIGMMICI